MSTKDPYEILGISRDATEADAKRAYRQLSLKHHPDRNNNSVESNQKFMEVSNAYDTLANPNHPTHPHPHPPPQFNDFIRQVFQQGPMPGGIFFSNQAPVPSLNIQMECHITLEQSYLGATIPLTIERQVWTGSQTMIETEIVYNTIPLGTDSGEFQLLPGKGNYGQGLDSTKRGDVRLLYRIQSHSVFQRQGLDLIFRKPISLKEALTGCEFEIPHLNGNQVQVNTKGVVLAPGRIQTYVRLGMPRQIGQGSSEIVYGNCLVAYEIGFPKTLTPEQIDKLDKILI